MTAILGKRIDKMTAGVRSSSYQPDNEDYIRTLDYDQLEKQFEIHKYYPKFIHNYDYSTPQIRAMLRDKPIYAKANKHVQNFKNPSTGKTFVTQFDVETGNIAVHEKTSKKLVKQKREKAEKEHKDAKQDRKLKHEQKKDHHDSLKEINEARRENHGDFRGKLHHELNEEKEETRRLLRQYRSQRLDEKTAQPYAMAAIKPPIQNQTELRNVMEFKNPFDLNQATMVSSQNQNTAALVPSHKPEDMRSRQNSVRTMQNVGSDTIKTSLGGKLRHMIRPWRSVEKHSNNLVRTSSYDQTQSMMTSTRGAKNKLLRLKDDSGRRMSAQIGTYTNFFIYSSGQVHGFSDRQQNVKWWSVLQCKSVND